MSSNAAIIAQNVLCKDEHYFCNFKTDYESLTSDNQWVNIQIKPLERGWGWGVYGPLAPPPRGAGKVLKQGRMPLYIKQLWCFLHYFPESILLLY
jgi:hypothetical protein